MLKFNKMDKQIKLSSFAKYAWFTLLCNVIVIVWGVFLRASKSGDGCGQHWLTCNGELIPSAPELKTIIEYSHRIMSGIDFLIVLGLVIWAFVKFQNRDQIRQFALVSFIFIVTEAALGAGLVLTGNTAENLTTARPYWAIGHLINTFILLGALTITAWLASRETSLKTENKQKAFIILSVAVFGILLIGTSGSLAALSGMLFPVDSLVEGFQQDFASDSHGILRLRISHPILSILVGVFLVFIAGWLKNQQENNYALKRFANTLSILILVQLLFGAMTLLTHAPIIMQLGHLLLADAVWIVFILMSASFFEKDTS